MITIEQARKKLPKDVSDRMSDTEVQELLADA